MAQKYTGFKVVDLGDRGVRVQCRDCYWLGGPLEEDVRATYVVVATVAEADAWAEAHEHEGLSHGEAWAERARRLEARRARAAVADCIA